MSEEKRKQFNEAITDVQNVFFDIFSKYEGYEVENSRNREDISDLKEQLKTSESKRQELAAKYSNLRVSFFRDHFFSILLNSHAVGMVIAKPLGFENDL